MKLRILFASTFLLGSTQFLAAMPVDPLLGSWKVIDDKSGSYITEIAIRKNSKTQQYSAAITKSYALPGAVATDVCTKCTGALKNKDLFGLEILTSMQEASKNKFNNGVWVNPQNGLVYTINANLSGTGDQMKVFGKSKSDNTTTMMTWKKF
jgi:hypothetical protein